MTTTAQDQQRPELLPCPFCGSPNVTLEHIQRSAYEAFCEFCGASGPCDSEQWRAAKGWNARALPAPGVDPMLDTPAGMEPVARVKFTQRKAPDVEWLVDEVWNGTDLFTAAQVQAMGRVPPGWQAVPVDLPPEMKREAMDLLMDGIDLYPRGETVVVETAAPDRLWRAMLAAASRPPAAQEREPLTDGQIKEAMWRTHLRWLEQCDIDTEGMRPTGTWLEHWLIYARAVERAHGITGGSDGIEPG